MFQASKLRRPALALAVTLLMAGCASVSPEGAFTEVADTASAIVGCALRRTLELREQSNNPCSR